MKEIEANSQYKQNKDNGFQERGGHLPNDLNFVYNNVRIEIDKQFCYLGVVFISDGSNFKTLKTLSGQAHKTVFTLNLYFFDFTVWSPLHKLELFDKLASPILNFGSEVWGLYKSSAIETVDLQFCKKKSWGKTINSK